MPRARLRGHIAICIYGGADALQLAMMTQMVTHVVLWEGSMWLLTLQSHILD